MKNSEKKDEEIKKRSKEQKQKTFQKLGKIKAKEAELYASDLVIQAVEKFQKMEKAIESQEYKVKEGLDKQEYKELLENSKELSQIADQIREKIQANVAKDKKSRRRLGVGIFILLFIIFIITYTVGSMIFG